jgi:DNA-binding FadR family transcriptional regulator
MSSISSVSSAGYLYQPNYSNASNPLLKSLQAVSSAVESGNVADAQSALAKFQKQLQGNSQTASSQPFGNNSQANSAYQSLVSSVQSGNLSDADKAVSSLKAYLKTSKAPAASASSKASSAQTSSSQAAEDLQGVGSALQSGNLSSALSAVTSIQTSSFGSNSQATSDYQSLVTALQTGNISAAQQAYAALNADLS